MLFLERTYLARRNGQEIQRTNLAAAYVTATGFGLRLSRRRPGFIGTMYRLLMVVLTSVRPGLARRRQPLPALVHLRKQHIESQPELVANLGGDDQLHLGQAARSRPGGVSDWCDLPWRGLDDFDGGREQEVFAAAPTRPA